MLFQVKVLLLFSVLMMVRSQQKQYIFRMDDIEDWYHSDIQANMLNFFMDKGVAVSAGIIGDYVTGDDTALLATLQKCVGLGKSKCALFNHGADASYTYGSATSTSEAYTRMKTCDDKIKSLFPGYTVDLFVPHQNSWNQYTLAAAKQLGYAAVSASTESYSNMQYDITTDPLQLSQQTTTAVYNAAGSWDAYPIASTVADCNTAASNGQVCVIMTHPHEFSEGSYTLTMLQQLVDALAAAGFTSVNFKDAIDQVKGLTKAPSAKPTANPTSKPTITMSPTYKATAAPTFDNRKRFIFRMDDIEDYYHNDIQANMLNFFIDKGVSVTAGVIGDYVTGEDTVLMTVLNRCVSVGVDKCALFNHGADASYTYGSATSTSEAYTRMKTCDDKIKALFPGYTVDLFVPHQNSWNQYTLAAAKQLGYAAVSASTESYSNLQYDITTDPLQLSQQTTTAVYNDAGSWDAYPIASTVADCNTAASNGQVCVIMTHPHEFSEGSYTLTMLQQLVDALAAAGFSSVSVRKVVDEIKGTMRSPTTVPTASATKIPTVTPSRSPTNTPTIPSTKTPTQQPTRSPTAAFTSTPTRTPTTAPTTASTRTPTQVPTRSPTATPTRNPTRGPTATPTRSPTQGPTRSPTRGPTTSPSAKKTNSPSFRPSAAPTNGQPKPTAKPSIKPTLKPTSKPTGFVIQLDLLSILFPTLAKSHSLDSSSLPTDLLTYLMDHNIGVSVGVSSSSVSTDDTDYYNALKRCVSLGSSKCELYVQGSSSVSVQGNLGSVDDVKAQIQSADEKIKSLFDGYTPQVYVPSSGSWSNATLAAAKEAGFAVVASTDSSLGWDLSASPMQISPQTSTGVQDSTGTWSAKSTETIIADCTAASARGEACVIQMTANEFASGAYTTEKVSELVSGLQAAGFTDSMTFDTIISAVQGGSPTRAPSESPLDTSSTSKGGVMSYLSDPADYMIAVVVVVGLLLVAAVAYAVIMCNMRSKEEYNIVKSKSADLSSGSNEENFHFEPSTDDDEEKSLPSTVRRSVIIEPDVKSQFKSTVSISFSAEDYRSNNQPDRVGMAEV